MALDTYQHTQWGRQGITLNHPANPLELVQEPFTQHVYATHVRPKTMQNNALKLILLLGKYIYINKRKIRKNMLSSLIFLTCRD